MAADLRASRSEAAAGELVRRPRSGLSRELAVTSPQLSLYSAWFWRGGGWAAGDPESQGTGACLPKRRPRADNAARIGDCLHHCAGCRADRAVFHRLESVPAAVRGRGHPRDRRAGACCRRARCAVVADPDAAAALGGGRCRQRSRQGSRRQARRRVQSGRFDARPVARQRTDDRRLGGRSRSRSERADRSAADQRNVQSGVAVDRPPESHRPRRAT